MALTGAKGGFNKLIAGDERGWCLGTAEMCKNWTKYDQHVIVVVKLRPVLGKPAMAALTTRFFAAPKAAQ